MLRASQHNFWNYFVTGDENWFYLETSHEIIRFQHYDPHPVPDKNTINSPKVMITVFWSPTHFHLIERLPFRQIFTSNYFSQTIFYMLQKNFFHLTDRRIVVYINNALEHCLKVTIGYLTKFKFSPTDHPPYSPDLKPFDFFLVKALKHKLERWKFNNATQLLNALIEITGSMSWFDTKAIFMNLEECL
jgi:transposase